MQKILSQASQTVPAEKDLALWKKYQILHADEEILHFWWRKIGPKVLSKEKKDKYEVCVCVSCQLYLRRLCDDCAVLCRLSQTLLKRCGFTCRPAFSNLSFRYFDNNFCRYVQHHLFDIGPVAALPEIWVCPGSQQQCNRLLVLIPHLGE